MANKVLYSIIHSIYIYEIRSFNDGKSWSCKFYQIEFK